jgi:hypothetical protein
MLDLLNLLMLASTAAFILGGSAVGIRLLTLAWRTREFTDFAVAFALFELSGIAYPMILAGAFGGFSLSVTRGLLVATGFSMAIGFAGVFIFTQRAFRPQAAWARALSALGIAVLFYGAIAGAVHAQSAVDFDALESTNSPLLWIQVAAVAVYLWTSLEGWRCWLQARRRLAIGLADPLVVNRFALWTWIGIFALVSVGPGLVLALGGKNPLDYPMTRLLTGLSGVGTTVAMQLAFLPPAAYRRWVAARASA